MRQVHIFFKISNAQQCLFPCIVRFVNWKLNWKLNMKLFLQLMSVGLAWKSAAKVFRTISGSQMGSQLLQNMEIVKQTDVLLWKIWRKSGSVSFLFSCTAATILFDNRKYSRVHHAVGISKEYNANWITLIWNYKW